jgi:hypothetical protein
LYDQQQVLSEWRISQEDESFNMVLDCHVSHVVRAELRDATDSMRALTNPIYFEREDL